MTDGWPERTVLCVCGGTVPVGESELIWLQTDQGMTACRSHQDDACIQETIDAMAAAWGSAKRIEEPKSKAERALEQQQRTAEYEELARRLL